MNRTIAEKSMKGSLEEKKNFLIKFLKRKLLEMGQKQAIARTLGEDTSPERKSKRTVRFRRGDKVFSVKEVISGNSSSENEDEASLIAEFETLFLMNEDEREKKKKKKLNPNQKRCPIKCPKEIMQMDRCIFAIYSEEKAILKNYTCV